VVIMKLICYHYDTCLPDYFGGHHAPHVCIPAYPMSLIELKDAIRSEINQGAIGGSLSYENAESEKLYKAMIEAVNEIEFNDGIRQCFNDVEKDDDYNVMAYFVFLDENGRFSGTEFFGEE